VIVRQKPPAGYGTFDWCGGQALESEKRGGAGRRMDMPVSARRLAEFRRLFHLDVELFHQPRVFVGVFLHQLGVVLGGAAGGLLRLLGEDFSNILVL
jgi:hypothetical protein